MTALDVSNNIYLQVLDISHNQITGLDLSNNRYIQRLYIAGNQLTNLDLTNNGELEELFARFNNLYSVNLTNNPALQWVYLGYNRLTDIDLSNNYNLEFVDLMVNDIPSIDYVVGWEQIRNIWFDPQRYHFPWLDASMPFSLELGSDNQYSELEFSFPIPDAPDFPDPSNIPGKHFCTTNMSAIL
ncbi:MAG: hypothetical protein FWE27_09100 [Defluviitaleaceae bacterium]|nr:hypothetical protein [Defluviitaleaceae bacterium]